MIDAAELDARIRASPAGLRAWAVVETDRLAAAVRRPRTTVLAAFVEGDPEAWREEVHARRRWLDHDVVLCGLLHGDRGVQLAWTHSLEAGEVVRALVHGPAHPGIDPGRAALRTAWRSQPWPSSVLESAVWLDVIDDELVWWGARHEKGDCEFENREPVPSFLERRWISKEAPPGLQDEIVAAIRAHRSQGADRDPSLAARRGALSRLELLIAEGASIEHRDLAGRTPLAAALGAPYEPVALHLLEVGASLEEAIAYAYGDEARPHTAALALDMALRRQWFAFAAAMVARGAPVDAPALRAVGAPASSRAVGAPTSPSGVDAPATLRAWEVALLSGAPVALIEEMVGRGARLDPESAVWTSARFHAFAWRSAALAALSPVPVPPPPAPPVVVARPPRKRSVAAGDPGASAAMESVRALVAGVAAGDLAAIDRALVAGASAQQVGWDGQLALHHASAAPDAAQAPIVARLLAAGAPVDARDRSSATALTKAVRRGALGAVRALLEAGADPKQVDDGAPLTVHAVLVDAPEILEALLAAGADPRAIDARRKSALDVARQKRNAACEALLRRHLA